MGKRQKFVYFVALVVLCAAVCTNAVSDSEVWRADRPTKALLSASQSTCVTREDACLHTNAGTFDTSGMHILREEQQHSRRARGVVEQYYVRVSSPLSERELATLEQAVTGMGPYVPHNTYVVICDALLAKKLGKLSFVSWVGVRSAAHRRATNLITPPVVSRRQQNRQPSSITLYCETVGGSSSFAISSAAPLLALNWRPALEVLTSGQQGLSLKIHAPAKAKVVIHISSAADGPELTQTVTACVDFLTSQPEVLWVERRHEVSARNSNAQMLLGGDSLTNRFGGEPLALRHGLQGRGQIVSIADSGIDYDSCFFWEPKSLGIGLDLSRRKIVDYRPHRDCESCGADCLCGDHSDDSIGHGTHVAGSVMGMAFGPQAQALEVTAAAAHNGVASESKIAFLDIQRGRGRLRPPDVMDNMMAWAYSSVGARVQVIAWGCSTDSGDATDCNVYSTSAMEIDAFVWANPEMLVVIAAGNDGDVTDRPTIGAPATSKNCLAVGASLSWNDNVEDSVLDDPPTVIDDDATSQDAASFTAKGPAMKDRRIKPDVIAPGVNVLSANSDGDPQSSGPNGCQCAAPSPFGQTDTGVKAVSAKSGTSMSAPLVAGLALLIRQYLTEGWYPSGRPTPSDAFVDPSAAIVKAMIIASAQCLTGRKFSATSQKWIPLDPLCPGDTQGFGRPVLDNILYYADNSQSRPGAIEGGAAAGTVWLVDWSRHTHEPLRAGTTIRFDVNVTNNSTFAATLVWTDFAGTPAASMQLVNDLDLTVRINGTTSYGNGGQAPDYVNNVERLEIPAERVVVANGVLSISVHAYRVASGFQQYFALVLQGEMAGAPVITRTERLRVSPSPISSTDQQGDAQVELGIDYPLSSFVQGDPVLEHFETTLIDSLSKALRLPPWRWLIDDVRPDKIISSTSQQPLVLVQLTIVDDEDKVVGQSSAFQVAEELQSMVADQSSVLYDLPVTSNIHHVRIINSGNDRSPLLRLLLTPVGLVVCTAFVLMVVGTVVAVVVRRRRKQVAPTSASPVSPTAAPSLTSEQASDVPSTSVSIPDHPPQTGSLSVGAVLDDGLTKDMPACMQDIPVTVFDIPPPILDCDAVQVSSVPNAMSEMSLSSSPLCR